MKKILSDRDFYTQKAKQENYPSRAVYKLKEIQQRFSIIKAGDKVLDLGASPGSWILYLSEKVGKKGRVIGIDRENLKIILPQNTVFIQKDIFDLDLLDMSEMQNEYDVVVSDLAPKTTGIKFKDAENSFILYQRALEIAKAVLVQGGNFVCKMFEGEKTKEFLQELKNFFETVKIVKPKAVRKASKEIYIVAKNKSG